MAMIAKFEGYRPDYSKVVGTDKNYLTWVILKAHTNNVSGAISLRSADPLEPPHVNFNQFHDGAADDIRAVIDGVRFVRKLNAEINRHGIGSHEELPGGERQTDGELEEHVRRQAWGHHACGTCAIGSPDRGGVVGTDFRVHHTTNLRVVDASVFPRIPGFFIVCAVYMIGEKAAETILASAGAGS